MGYIVGGSQEKNFPQGDAAGFNGPRSFFGLGARGSSTTELPYKDDPNAYLYHGPQGDAAASTDYYRGLGNQAAQGMVTAAQPLLTGSAVAMDPAVMAGLRAQANGSAPNDTQIRMQQALQQSVAAQQAQMSGARGAGAMGMAQGMGGAGLASQQEQMAAQGAQIRQGQQEAAQRAYAAHVGAQANLNTTAKGAGLDAIYSGLQARQGYSNLAEKPQSEQLQAQIQEQADRQAAFYAAIGRTRQETASNDDQNSRLVSAGTGLASGGVSKLLGF